ncbi:MAG: hypothetical protein KDK10_14535 [Maritimibacter sp.]|nr:hypothetical protein [Maritimibacter sp.]
MVGLVGLGFAASMAQAQESSNQVVVEEQWSVFVEENPKECWSVSEPTKTVNTRDGQTVSVTRGDILLFVVNRPGTGGAGEVAFTGGYPFRPESTVSVAVGGETFQMFTDGEWAWAHTSEDDAKIIAAMKKGADAVLTAESSRGTKTEDTFSLIGFTAAVEDAAARCQ